ncbi:MAG: Stk1 family PASTA domain-containing Ser/Thr kinase [Clostridium sp.]|nr:Stk1 family PASTA domain-containing Ser/Thr kinase [Clostridium sp.]
MIGKILGGRYEILEQIGEGGMSIVYKAMDKKLNRNVAAKVLKSEFSDNADVVKKFKIEATAIATLSDNNIVNILDVGSQEDTNYIIMEYVDGSTLKELIKFKGQVHYEDALTLAIQIARALDCAHKNGIIHRDVKPQNMLITKDGLLKVTDFGIAKSSTSATLTSTTTIMGSAHYFSPEQATGSKVDVRTDLYSLGVVLYEMVTGKVPFDADSPVTIALKHIQEEPVPPKKLNTKIPESLNVLILKAMAKDPSKRYQTAKEMLVDLEKIKADPDVVLADSIDENEEEAQGKTIIMDAVNKKVPVVDVNEANVKKQVEEDDDFYDDDEYEDDDEYYDDDDDEEDDDERGNNVKKVLFAILGGLVGVVAIFLIAFFAFGGTTGTSSSASSDKVTVPDIKGMTYDQAKVALERIGLEIVDAGTTKSDEKEGTIVESDPAQGTEVAKGTKVRVITSSGTEKLTMPDFADSSYEDVKRFFNKNQIQNVTYEYEYSDDIEADSIIRTEPKAKSEITKDTKVTVYISKGKKIKNVTVPTLYGKSRDEAVSILTQNKLQYKVQEKEVSDKTQDGIVVAVSHAEGTVVVENAVITITVGKYKEPVTPPVEEKHSLDEYINTSMTAEDAAEYLRSLGYTNISIDGDSAANITHWSPAGAKISKNDAIVLYTTSIPSDAE